MLMRGGDEIDRPGTTFRHLRFMASVGEPLNPEAVVWGDETPWPSLPRQLVADRNRRHHDRQFRRQDIKPGSMGRPLPGVEAAIVSAKRDGGVRDDQRTAKEGRARA